MYIFAESPDESSRNQISYGYSVVVYPFGNQRIKLYFKKRKNSTVKIVLQVLLSISLFVLSFIAVLEYYISKPPLTRVTYNLDGVNYRIIDIANYLEKENVPSLINIYIEKLNKKEFNELIQFLLIMYTDPERLSIDKTVYERYNENFDAKNAILFASKNVYGCAFCFHALNYRESHVSSGTCTRFIRMTNKNGLICFKEYSDNPRDTCLSLEIPMYPYLETTEDSTELMQ